MICERSGPPGFNFWTSVAPAFQSWFAIEYCLISSQWWILIYTLAVLIHWWVEVLHADRTSICVLTIAEPSVRLLQRKTGLRPRENCYWPFQSGAYAVVHFTYLCNWTYWVAGYYIFICRFYYCVLRVFYNICNELRHNLGWGCVNVKPV